MSCHVMSFDVVVMSFDAVWLFVLCHVTWCNAMSCDVRSCDELSSVVPCNGMECYELKMLLVVKTRCVVRSGSVTMWWSKVWSCTTKNYSSTSPVLLCTTKKYSSTTLYYKVLLQYYSVLLCTTKYYSSPTLYYKVALMIDPCHIWTGIFSARSNKSHPPTSPSIAPATENHSHDWSSS